MSTLSYRGVQCDHIIEIIVLALPFANGLQKYLDLNRGTLGLEWASEVFRS